MGSEKNPVEQYLLEKTAGPGMQAFGASLRGHMDPAALGSRAADGVAHAAMGAVGGAALAGAAFAGHAVYDAATKARDFKSMLEANPDLAAEHAENPAPFNQMFSTLRTFNPAFSKDPIVAGTYMRQMVADPVNAGGKVLDAIQYRDKVKSPYGDMVMRGAQGKGPGKGHDKKE